MRDDPDHPSWCFLAAAHEAAAVGELLLARDLAEARFRVWQLTADLDAAGISAGARYARALLEILETAVTLPASGAGPAYARLMKSLDWQPEQP